MNLLVIGRAGDDIIAAVAAQLLSMSGAARLIGCDRGTVHSEVRRGNLHVIRVPAGMFITRQEALDYKARRRGQRFAEAFPTRESEL
jgi:hypothetical protein